MFFVCQKPQFRIALGEGKGSGCRVHGSPRVPVSRSQSRTASEVAIRFCLAPRLRMSEVISPVPHRSSWYPQVQLLLWEPYPFPVPHTHPIQK